MKKFGTKRRISVNVLVSLNPPKNQGFSTKKLTTQAKSQKKTQAQIPKNSKTGNSS